MKHVFLLMMMVIFLSTISYAINAPVDIEISHNNTHVLLNWNPVTSANSYKVFVCDIPYGAFTLDETGVFTSSTSWTKPETSPKMFYQVTAVTGLEPVNLRSAENYVILAKSAISTVPSSAITGDVGLSPAAASYITGFSLSLDPSGTFSTSPQVTGHLFAADYVPPTPSNLTTAISNMETAYVDAAGRPTPDFNNLLSGDISGQTLVPGLYKWNGQVIINTPITLSGAHDDVWIFQIAGGVTMAPNTSVILGAGAQAKNIFWQVVDQVELGAHAHMEGIVLCSTAIILGFNASVNGRLLAQTAVTLDQNTVTQPSP